MQELVKRSDRLRICAVLNRVRAYNEISDGRVDCVGDPGPI